MPVVLLSFTAHFMIGYVYISNCQYLLANSCYLNVIIFFFQLFEVHPMSKSLFKNGMQSQGTFLVKMISLALSALEDPENFDTSLMKLAEVHYYRGVKSVECK